MMRLLQYFNVIGVLALAVLCAVQWQVNRKLNLEINSLTGANFQQQAKIADQAETIKQDAADLDELRSRLEIDEATVRSDLEKIETLQHKLTVSGLDRRQLALERDALKSVLDKWKAAVAQRDAVLKDADGRLKQLIDDRNAAVMKFNDLARKYNDLVKEMDKKNSAPQ
jgi:chromosome segregation ATPase